MDDYDGGCCWREAGARYKFYSKSFDYYSAAERLFVV